MASVLNGVGRIVVEKLSVVRDPDMSDFFG